MNNENNNTTPNQEFGNPVPNSNTLDTNNVTPQPVEQNTNTVVEPIVQPVVNEIPNTNNVTPQQTQTNTQPVVESQSTPESVTPQVNNLPPINNSNTPMPNNPQKNNKTMILIIAIGILVLAAAVVLIVVLLNGKDSGKKPVNDYESTQVNSTSTVDPEIESISYMGFNFPKKVGYTYIIEDNQLIINNTIYASITQVLNISFEKIKNNQQELVNSYNNLGFVTTNLKFSTYHSKEVITLEMEKNDLKMILYVFDAGNNFLFAGIAFNPSYVIDYNDVDTSVLLLKDAKYIGGYKTPTESTDVVEFKDIFK